MKALDLPQIGQILRDRLGDRRYTVADVFYAGAYLGMLLDWTDSDGRKRGQAFTTKDWRSRWEVIG